MRPALRELWAFRETVLAFAERDVRVKYKQAVLGNQIDKLIWDEVHSLTFYQVPDIVASKQKLANFGSFGFASVIYEDIGYKK